MRILLTGATGFIGKALIVELIQQNFNISIAVRQKTNLFPDKVKQFIVGNFENNPDFSASLSEVDCVIHIAGKAHVIDKVKASALDEFRKINTELTLDLAKQAVTAGVERFVFLSSIGVNGNQNNQPFLEIDTPNPQEPYAISKYEAEQGLFKLAKETDMEVVIIRPPLVYGANAPGNFGRLMSWASKKYPMPLPLGLVGNSRSLVAIDNLVDFIVTCVTHKNAANEVFLISDREDLSTTQLLRKIAKAFGKKVFLLPVPVQLMIFMAGLLGRRADAIRLFSSLRVDSSKVKELLDWDPKITMDEQLLKIAKAQKINVNVGNLSCQPMKRFFDFSLAVFLIFVLWFFIIISAILVKITSKGNALYWSDRVGINNKIFKMPKFRSMLIDTPAVATHLLDNPNVYLSPIGGFLRSTSLDELPQLFSVLKGDMSFVGPRPALFNQEDLIALRTKKGVDKLLPGITGWAQVNGRDELSIPDKVALDAEYLDRQSFWFDMKILWMTFLKVIKRDGVSH